MEPIRLHNALNWLIDTAAEIVPGETLEGTLERYLDRLLRLLGAEQGSIMLRQNDQLSIVAAQGLSEEVSPGMRVGLEDGPAGVAVLDGAARLLQGDLTSSRSTQRPTSSMVIPLRVRERVVGVLNVGKLTGADAFNEEDLQVISVIAGQLAWILSHFELMSKIWSLAITDELTGLYNRRFFQLRLREEIQRSGRFDKPFCLVMIDLDGFKELNRGHGHQVGDEILAHISTVIRLNLRAVDVVARYGGDEMVAILPETTVPAAYTLIERLQRAVMVETFVGKSGVPVKLSLCAGIAQFPVDAVEPEDLIRKADGALLEAKRVGSGRILLVD